MAQQPLLTTREEAQGLRLAQRQPQSALALQALIESVRGRIVAAVLAEPRVRERLEGTRYRVVGADLREEKLTEESQTPRRLADVGLYDYDHDVLIVVAVDLRAGIVLDIEERTGLQPPPTDEEVEEARDLILADQGFRSLRQHADLQVVAFPARATSMDEHRFRGHRILVLTFWTSGDQPSKVGEAAADLSTRAVVSVEEVDPFIAERGAS